MDIQTAHAHVISCWLEEFVDPSMRSSTMMQEAPAEAGDHPPPWDPGNGPENNGAVRDGVVEQPSGSEPGNTHNVPVPLEAPQGLAVWGSGRTSADGIDPSAEKTRNDDYIDVAPNAEGHDGDTGGSGYIEVAGDDAVHSKKNLAARESDGGGVYPTLGKDGRTDAEASSEDEKRAEGMDAGEGSVMGMKRIGGGHRGDVRNGVEEHNV